MTTFAKAQLLKYGWTEGKGLGKHETGITTALKPKLKFDTVGIGHKENHDQWWESVFNKAANNVKVESGTDDVSIVVKTEDATPEKPKGSLYGSFLKTSTLRNGVTIPEIKQERVEPERNVARVELTDEELFKACGGRTAHKGARHGLKLSGKLERIARQERELLGEPSSGTYFGSIKVIKKEEPADRSVTPELAADPNGNILPGDLEDYISRSKRKKHKRRMNKLTERLSASWSLSDENKDGEKRRAKSEKRKRDVRDDEDVAMMDEEDKKKERKKDKKEYKECSRKGHHECKSHRKSKKQKQRAEYRHRILEQYRGKFQRREIRMIYNKPSKTEEDIPIPPKPSRGATSSKREKQEEEIVHKNRYERLSRHAEEPPKMLRTEADRSNGRISKRRHAKFLRKHLNRLDKITEGLSAVRFDGDETGKKPVTNKSKVESIMEDLMAVNLAEDVTKAMKEQTKSKRKDDEGS